MFIESIEPGQTETRTFPVFFRTVGEHAVQAQLGKDNLELDNARYCTVSIKPTANVLIIDEADQVHSGYLARAMGPTRMTGIQAEIRTRDFLRDSDISRLAEFDVIFCCDVEPMDEVAVRHLEQFANSGGGVAFFMGPRTSVPFTNSLLFNQGQGLFPVQLRESYDVEEQIDMPTADIVPIDHPIFAPVMGLKNSFLDLVQVRSILTPQVEWLAAPPANTSVIATLRGDAKLPLVVEGRFGSGRTITFLTTAGPVWNNWMRNPTFPPILLLLEDYLAAGNYPTTTNVVGDSLLIQDSASTVTADVVVLSPSDSAERMKTNLNMQPVSDVSQTLRCVLGDDGRTDYHNATATPGIFDVWFRKLDATYAVNRFAFNVDCGESDLQLANRAQLLSSLSSAKPVLSDWDQFNPEPEQQPASALNRFLLVLLVTFLICEQALAFSASYHN